MIFFAIGRRLFLGASRPLSIATGNLGAFSHQPLRLQYDTLLLYLAVVGSPALTFERGFDDATSTAGRRCVLLLMTSARVGCRDPRPAKDVSPSATADSTAGGFAEIAQDFTVVRLRNTSRIACADQLAGLRIAGDAGFSNGLRHGGWCAERRSLGTP